MTQVDLNKEYVFEGSGDIAVILTVDRPHPEYPVIAMSKDSGVIQYATKEGYNAEPNGFYGNLIPISDQSFEIDEPVLAVTFKERANMKPGHYHYAGVEAGFHTVFPNGMTSWSCVNLGPIDDRLRCFRIGKAEPFQND